MTENVCHICVLGIGNVLWADEGFGVRCVEALQQRYEFAPHVQLIDGGTQGLYLMQYVQAATHLLIFDAVDYDLAPGTLQCMEDKEVLQFKGVRKMSLHQTGFQDVLALAQLTGRYPEKVMLIGCQPEELEDYGGSLRPLVRAAMERALNKSVEVLRSWGARPVSRTSALEAPEVVTFAGLELDRYEAQRPNAGSVSRTGDARFMPLA